MKILATTALIGLFGVPALATADGTTMDMKTNAPKTMVESASSKALTASMTKMMSTMDVTLTGKPDEDFVLMMLPHHQGAIDMAKVELRYGKDPTLRAMAQDIVAAQAKEIAEMREWQARHGK